MSEYSFSVLLSILSPFLNSAVPSIPPNFVLDATVYRLSQGGGYKSVGRRFGLDSADSCRAFYAVCKAENDKLGNLFEFRSDLTLIVGAFGWISLPNCCGPFVVVMGCLLHNFLLKCGETMPDDNVKRVKEEDLPVFSGEVNESGEKVRGTLAAHLSRVSLRK